MSQDIPFEWIDISSTDGSDGTDFDQPQVYNPEKYVSWSETASSIDLQKVAQSPSKTSDIKEQITQEKTEQEEDEELQPRAAPPRPTEIGVHLLNIPSEEKRTAIPKPSSILSYPRGVIRGNTDHIAKRKRRLKSSQSNEPYQGNLKNYGSPHKFVAVLKEEALEMGSQRDEENGHVFSRAHGHTSRVLRNKITALEGKVKDMQLEVEQETEEEEVEAEAEEIKLPPVKDVLNYDSNERIFEDLVSLKDNAAATESLKDKDKSDKKPKIVRKRVIGKQIDPKWKRDQMENTPHIETFLFRNELEEQIPFLQRSTLEPPIPIHKMASMNLQLSTKSELGFIKRYMRKGFS